MSGYASLDSREWGQGTVPMQLNGDGQGKVEGRRVAYLDGMHGVMCERRKSGCVTITATTTAGSDCSGGVSGALTTYYDDLMMGDDGGAAARGPAQSGRGEQEAGWRDRMEVAAAATQVNT